MRDMYIRSTGWESIRGIGICIGHGVLGRLDDRVVADKDKAFISAFSCT